MLGDAWERSYGELEFQKLCNAERRMPWYFIATDNQSSFCFGVKTGANSFVSFEYSPKGIKALVDCRNGGCGVDLGGRKLRLATFVYKKYASDINGDGKLDENDLTALTAKYGEVTGTECADNVEVYYRWGNSYSTCTATAMCTLCGKKVATETVNSVQNADGSYTATFTNTLLGTKTYKKTTT